MEKVNINSVYVIEKPKKNMLLLIMLNPEHLKSPLQDQWIWRLDKLSEICDIVYIFPPGSYKVVDCDKFSNLLKGKAWIVGDWRKTIPETLEYSLEIFKTHSFHIIFNLDNIMGLESEKILNLMMKGVRGPIFNIWRKSGTELYNYYRETSNGKEIWKKLPMFWKKENLIKANYYSLWSTHSKFIWIHRTHINNILEYSKEGMIDTFESLEDFFGSGIMTLGFSTFLNRDIELLDEEGVDPEGEKRSLPKNN